MSMLLENLIRTYLIEGRTVAKIRGASAKDTAAARAAGAVYAYNVLVKGTKNQDEIIDLVQAATLASTGVDTENRIAVGQSSKFARGDYVYVMSDPLPKKRQIIVVRIFKLTDITKNHLNFTNVIASYELAGSIGGADFFTATMFKQLLIGEKQDTTPVDDLKSKDSEASDVIKQASDLLAGNEQVTNHELKRDGIVVGKFNGTIDKNGLPLEGKAELNDGQVFDGKFKDGKFITGSCKQIISNGDIFEGELTDGVPTANVTHHITKPDGKYYEGTVNSSFLPIDGSVYSSSAKTEKIGDFILGAWTAVEKPLFTNQQIIDATNSSKYSDATKYFQQLMVDKIGTQPEIVSLLADTDNNMSNTYTKVKNNVDGKWGDNSKSLTKDMQFILGLPETGIVTSDFIDKIANFDKQTVSSTETTKTESILNVKNTLLEQIDLDSIRKRAAIRKVTPPPPTPKPKPTPTPKPKPKPKPTPTSYKDQYILQKDYELQYVKGSADKFLSALKAWESPAGYASSMGWGETPSTRSFAKQKIFDRKTIKIPKGTIVYIQPGKVIINVPSESDTGGIIPNWHFEFTYTDNFLRTNSYYNIWKQYDTQQKQEWKTAKKLGIQNVKFAEPKYQNDKLIKFLKTLNPLVQNRIKFEKELSKEQRIQLNDEFNRCIQIAKDFYELFEKNPKKYFGRYKGSSWIPGDQDLPGALNYLQDAVRDAYEDEFKLLTKSSNLDIQNNVKKLHDIYTGVQQYIIDLIRTNGNKRLITTFRIKLVHPYDSKKNTNVTIKFDYL